jgi:hypothetical protein
MQTSSVHWLPSTGTSVLSMLLTMFPAPSQAFVWQSPGVCEPVTVPADVNVNPHVADTQLRCLHSVSTPGHCEALLHWTHDPNPLHTVPPFWLHGVFRGAEGLLGTPFMHTSLVHWLPSTGTSELSAWLTTFPVPSQTRVWQSPGVCELVGIPAPV